MANPPISSLVDPLHAVTQDTTLWDAAANYGNLGFTTGGVVLSNPANYTAGSGFQSKNIYDLTNGQTSVRIVNGGLGPPSWEVHFELWQAGYPYYGPGWMLYSGTLYTYNRGGLSSFNYFTTLPYDPAVHKHLRLRNSATHVYWDWSTDGTTWTNLATGSLNIDATQVRAALFALTTANEASATSATFDDFGGLPPAPPVAIDASPAQAAGTAPAPTFTSVPTAVTVSVLAAAATASATAPTSRASSAAAQASAGATALAPSDVENAAVSTASATGAAPAPGVSVIKSLSAPTATAAASSAASTRVASSAPQSDAAGAAPEPTVHTVGQPIDINVAAARSSATAFPWAISVSATAPTATGSSQARGWAQTLQTNLTQALATGAAPAPVVSITYALDAPAADALGQAWPMAITTRHVSVPGPPIPAGVVVSARGGHVERPTVGLVRS